MHSERVTKRGAWTLTSYDKELMTNILRGYYIAKLTDPSKCEKLFI